jgi:transcription elongation factor S-II
MCDDVTEEVMKAKAVLEQAGACKEDILGAVSRLRAIKSLPTKVLSDTKIGIVVNQLAKAASTDSEVRSAAKDLVEDWRQQHRKRKAATSPDVSALVLKRSTSAVSNSASQDVVTQDSMGGASQVSEAQTSPGLARQDSLLVRTDSNQTEENGESSKARQQRNKVKEKIMEALGKEEEEDVGEMEDSMRDPESLANDIEQALYDQLKGERDDLKEYLSQARSILFNLKDKKNMNFRFKLMVGYFKPEELPKMTTEQMASDSKAAERAKMRKEAAEEIQTDWALRNGQLRISGTFTCGKCKGTKTTYFQMQTRSSDEPMTTFVTCLGCNNRWKFC